MADFGFFSGKDDSAVEDLISQAKDLYVLEQVAAINCSGFTDSDLPTNLENRFRRLKSLPVSRPDPVSSSEKLLSHSKSMASHPHTEKKNRGNASSGSAFSGDEKRTLSGIKRDPSVISGFEKNPRGVFGSETSWGFSDSGKMGSISSRFSREGKSFSPKAQTLKLVPNEKSRISSSSFTSIDLASPSSNLDDKEERSNRKSKSKLSISWFGKLSSPSRAMGCLWPSPSKSSSNSKNTIKSCKSSDSGEQLKRAKIATKESKRMLRKADKLIKKSKALRGPFWFMVR